MTSNKLNPHKQAIPSLNYLSAMLKKFQSIAAISTVDHLKPGMVIVAYLDLEKKFANLDTKNCQWVKEIFHGSKTTIQRRNVQIDISVKNLKNGDTVFSIFDIPTSQKHYTLVDRDLIKYLHDNGFPKFKITHKKQSQIPETSTERKESNILADLNRSVELRKSKIIEKTTLYRPPKERVESNSNLLESLRQSEEARQHNIRVTKPTKFKKFRKVALKKDDILIGLKKAEELRQHGIGGTGRDAMPKIPSEPRFYHRMTRKEKVDQANEFLERMKKSIEIRSDAVGEAEDLMDKARQNKVNWSSINYYIDFIVKNSTTSALSALANIRASDQTYGHCVDVSAIFCSAYLAIKNQSNTKSIFNGKHQVMLAAFLHDFGKSQIPKDIIDSTMSFDRNSKEMQLIRSHPELGAKLLNTKMNVPNLFVEMALYHHVKKSRNHLNSYPPIKDSKKLLYETQLLSIVDVYQALIGKRSYSTSWSPAAAMYYLKNYTGSEFDRQIFNDFRRVMGDYPIGTVVKLSDESVGFVVSVPEKNLAKPSIVLVKDSKGHEISINPLIDLKTEKGLYITQDLNAEKELGNKAFELLKKIHVS